MAVHLVPAAADLDRLWRVTTYDTGCVSLTAAPSRGDGFPELLADALLQTGRIQPTLVPAQRASTRADLGRLQLGLVLTSRDVVVHAAEMLKPGDADLLALTAHRAGVDLWLMAHGPIPTRLLEQLERWHPTSWDPAAAHGAWLARPGAGGRATPWPCHAALVPHSGSRPAAGCTEHPDATGCFRAWAGHAIATARVDERVLRARAYELVQVGGGRAWGILADARDLSEFARRAATRAGLGPGAQRKIRLRDVPDDASVLHVDAGHPVPQPLRAVLANHRAVRIADGFRMSAPLLRPSAPSLYQYQRARPGDPADREKAIAD